MKLLLSLLFLFISLNSFSQDWKIYSDSIYNNLLNSNIEKAEVFLGLAEKDIIKNTYARDTIYADFLYRKGLVQYNTNNYRLDDFKESLIIWENSVKKNPLKIMKIHFFLGRIFYSEKNYKEAYVHYEKCYNINKINDLEINNNYVNSIYQLLQIDYYQNNDDENVKKYALEYIKVTKGTAVTNFNFNYIFAYDYINDYGGGEEALLQFLNSYKIRELNDPDLLVKIYYYLGEIYNTNKDYEVAYECFVENYNYYKQNDLKVNYYIERSIYRLLLIDYYQNNDDENVKKYALEYIELLKDSAIEDFNFTYIYAFNIMEDFKGEKEALLQFLKGYNEKKITDPSLLFKINYELMTCYSDLESPVDEVKYGEKALKIMNNNKLNLDEKEHVYLSLISGYSSIGDNINMNKYEKLIAIEYPEEDETDYTNALDLLLIEEDYEQFENLFLKLEAKLIQDKDFNSLIDIYSRALNLFEKGILFEKQDIENQFALIGSNINILTKENKLYFDAFLTEFEFFNGNYLRALTIANDNIENSDIVFKLLFYRYKIIAELYLGTGKGLSSIITVNQMALEQYGENSPQLLPFLLIYLIDPTMERSTSKKIKIAVKGLEIIYSNKLEKTDIAAQFWTFLALQSMLSENYLDAEIYFKNALNVFESKIQIQNPAMYVSCLIGLAKNYNSLLDIENSKKYFIQAKSYLDNTNLPSVYKMSYGDYYFYYGDFLFWQDKFQEAKETYTQAFEVYGDLLSKGRNLNYILCDYFLLQNSNKTIKDLENYYNINGDQGGVLKLIYLLKFNLNKTSESRDLLITSINHIIENNNEYFHLLSNDEKETLYSNITDQFEFLSTHLLFPYDDLFLDDFINKRFYFKSLIFNNNVNNIDESKFHLLELNANKILLSKYFEQQVDYDKEINALLNKNRELEKFLAQSKVKVEIPTVSEIQNNLKPDEAYVEIIRINKQSRKATKGKFDIVNQFTDSIYYGAIIIKNNTKPKFVLIDKTNKLEKEYLKNYKNYIDGEGKYIADKESYALFFESLESSLKGMNRMFFVSDGIYNSINIEAFYNTAKEKYLLEYLDVNRIISAKSILNKAEDNDKLTATLIGNPQFDINQTTIEQKENNQIVLRDFKMDYLRENVGDKQLSYLPGTERELNTIDRILKDTQFNVDLFTNENATEKNLKNIESPKILHLATHGYFLRTEDKEDKALLIMGMRTGNLESNVYLKSGILLAGAQNTLDGNDSGIDLDNGIFTAEEAKSLNLKNTDLVVLSACETGLGDNKVGEGVYGLQRAFMIAGSKSVIMSLWKVDDNTTQKLMKLFYSNWLEKNMSKAEAFKTAKLEIKNNYPEPFYWAPFVLIE